MFNKSILARGIRFYVVEMTMMNSPRVGLVFQKSAAGYWVDILAGKRKFAVGWWNEKAG